ncbi:MAG TPA: hypothetical protein ENJ75_01335 [Candidatus Kaiserbacteria bacterium]|nr:hypothetical protein [Candidatus Kaiserbacteria bacterium]
MQQKTILGVIIVIVLIAGGFAVWNYTTGSLTSAPAVSNSTTQTKWKSYTDPSTGFTFKYPTQYVVKASPLPLREWGTRYLLTVEDKPNSTSSFARAAPMTVNLIKQPVLADRKIYHTIAKYQQSGTPAKMRGGNNGNIVSVNGTQALLYHTQQPSDETGIRADGYLFIHNDLIYEVGIDPNNPLSIQILNSIHWK